MPKSLQGQGITKDLFKALVKQYESANIDMISVTANIDVGGYAWGKYGFTAENFDGLYMIQSRADSQLTDPKEVAEWKQWAKEAKRTDKPDMNALARYPWAKKILLGSYWKGEIDLNDPVRRQIFLDYLNGKK